MSRLRKSTSCQADRPQAGSLFDESLLYDGLRQTGCIANDGRLLTTSSKRRRNTEASARFRAKKKEREQAVEKRASESSFSSLLSLGVLPYRERGDLK